MIPDNGISVPEKAALTEGQAGDFACPPERPLFCAVEFGASGKKAGLYFRGMHIIMEKVYSMEK